MANLHKKYKVRNKLEIKVIGFLNDALVHVKLSMSGIQIAQMAIPVEIHKDKRLLKELMGETLNFLGYGPKEGFERRYEWAS